MPTRSLICFHTPIHMISLWRIKSLWYAYGTYDIWPLSIDYISYLFEDVQRVLPVISCTRYTSLAMLFVIEGILQRPALQMNDSILNKWIVVPNHLLWYVDTYVSYTISKDDMKLNIIEWYVMSLGAYVHVGQHKYWYTCPRIYRL